MSGENPNHIFPDGESPSSSDPSVEKTIFTLAGGASLSLAGKFAGRLLGFLGDIAAARILGPVLFGLYAIGWTILRLLSLLSPMGLDKGVIFFAAPHSGKEGRAVRRIIDRSAILALVSGSAFGLFLFLAAPWLSVAIFQKPDLAYIIRWFALSFPLSSTLAVILAATKITLNMKYAVWIQDIFQPAAGLFFLLLFYCLGFRLAGVLAADVISFAAALGLGILILRKLFPRLHDAASASPPANQALLAFSVPAALAGMFTPFLMWVDRLFVGAFRPASEMGVYQAASQTSVVFGIILVALSAIITPMITPLHQKRQIRLMEELFRVSTKWGLYASLPIFIWVSFFSRQILSAIFGTSFGSGWPILIILTVGQLVNVGTGAVGPILIMTGHQKRWSLLSGAALLANIFLNWCLVPKWGVMGAALGTACSLSTLFLIGVLQIRKVLGIWPYDRRYLKGLLAAAFSGIAFWILDSAFSPDGILSLGIVLLSGTAVFLIALLASGLDREDTVLLTTVLSRSPFRRGKEPQRTDG
ncbi:MAG: flippase [Anaerolineales bacterium]|nr:flippase [Anaerolineales bacterium]